MVTKSVARLLVTLLVAVLLWMQVRPFVLTKLYGEELKLAIQNYQRGLASIEGQSDPAVMAEIATGDYLAYLIKVRCNFCSSVQVATKVEVVDLQVLDHSPSHSKVYARVEYGWSQVSPSTRAAVGSCHAQAFSAIYNLMWQEGRWKVAGGEDVNADRVDDAPELLERYCESD